jgi:RNA polymerase sigma factor (sigma-70 family)
MCPHPETVEQATEVELVRLARAGDKHAFGCLIERYQPLARRIALIMVGNETVAKDLAQEAMLQAYLSLKSLRVEQQFKSWLYGITLNVCRSYLRDQKINFFSWETIMGGVRLETGYPAQPILTPQEVVEARELHHLVLHAVESLSPKNKAATLLFYYEGLSLQEIAALLNVSVVAVKGRLHKSRKLLRELLLPLYLNLNLIERSRTMVKVTVADVVAKKIETDGSEEQKEHLIIMLLDEVGRRILPIWVGPFEGRAIAMGIRGVATQRPLTFNLMTNLFETTGIELEEIYVNALRDETFYAVVKFRHGNKLHEIDARPSDAIALAVRTNKPIYVAEEVLEKAAMDVSEEMKQAPRLGRGLDAITQEMEAEMAGWQKKSQAIEEQAEAEEKQKKMRQELKAFVFGVG